MAEGGSSIGRGYSGRGALIAKLLEREKKPGPTPPPTPPEGDGPPPQTVQPQIQRPLGGRGAMFQRVQSAAVEQPQQPPTPTHVAPALPVAPAITSQPSGAQPPIGGRGRLLAMAGLLNPQPVLTVPAGIQSQTTARPVTEAEVKSLARQVKRIEMVDRPPVKLHGTSGEQTYAMANYICLELKQNRGIFEYEVRFSPSIDDKAICDKLLFVEHKEVLGRRRTFDGVTLYLPHQLPEETIQLTSLHPITKETHTISLIFRRQRSMGECTHMYNVLFNNIQKELNLVRLKNREFFSQENAIQIPQHKLEVWPGYVTAVDYYEGGIMLNCNISSKVLCTRTVLELIEDIVSARRGPHDWKEVLQRQIIGQSVMTRNPVNLYRVDDIDFNQNPTSTFTKPDGTMMDYVEYHRRKNIEIKDLRQPLLVHRPKPSKRPGGTGLLMLIPELCYLTGLSDETRSDYRLMKDIATYTRINPNQRHLQLQNFLESIRRNPNCVKLLDEWGLKVPDDTIKLSARVLPPEKITFGGNFRFEGSKDADWNREACRQQMLEVVPIQRWLVICDSKNERFTGGFVDMMFKVCPQMGVKVYDPDFKTIPNDRTETYVKTLKESLTADVQLVVIVFPSPRDDRYSAVKKFCCVQRPIPSQVINSKTISRADKLRSIVQKIALQINCKLGGALWAINLPTNLEMMICGVDTYHDTKNRSQSVAAFVSSMNPAVTRWYSQTLIMSSDREMVDGITSAVCISLAKYVEVNNQHPKSVVIFRDGVGDGQLAVCKELEIAAIQKAFATISPDYNPKLAFIVCQKRINTRIFVPSQSNRVDNPIPGTIVDHTITRRYYQDFFLVSQFVKQGTVTPVHYIVIHNTTTMTPDQVQRLTYKMCHLYYNWPGTVRVPAPCQYAHKLAFLVGNSLHTQHAEILSDKLFFL